MGGKHSPETRAAKAAALVAQLQGVPVEEVKIVLPVESVDDRMAQAEAAFQYFETSGDKFVHINCRECGELFAYKWDRHAIAYCSVLCAHENLKQRGLAWNPSRGPAQRWGSTAPIVVPAVALSHLQALILERAAKTSQEDSVPETQEQENLEQ